MLNSNPRLPPTVAANFETSSMYCPVLNFTSKHQSTIPTIAFLIRKVLIKAASILIHFGGPNSAATITSSFTIGLTTVIIWITI